MDKIIGGQIGQLVITHKIRLQRFETKLVFARDKTKIMEMAITDQGEDTSFQEDPDKDVLEICTVFCAGLHGSRSHKNQMVIDDAKRAAEC